ncbi:helix-turn-helix transcriptional regulator [Bacillus sp. FJAT-49732]|uniref:Helix-turn-helix transcriptional regulator n=1 Tax=Lederbergia citrisecunda TaxID=2833583 RepID=A0A942YL61_9BACI|nr:helix-turn-helix transcriptional regulator [Lederbergia citrisecunda]MBS4200312.1 helix-turn-helix transcriptional regulator [Lederbergia citrisecunda]
MAWTVGRCLLRERLKAVDMSQQELADKLEVKVQQINKYVLDKQKMSYQTAANISFIVHCDMKDLYEWIWTE